MVGEIDLEGGRPMNTSDRPRVESTALLLSAGCVPYECTGVRRACVGAGSGNVASAILPIKYGVDIGLEHQSSLHGFRLCWLLYQSPPSSAFSAPYRQSFIHASCSYVRLPF